MSEPDHRRSSSEFRQGDEVAASSTWSPQSWSGPPGFPPIHGTSVQAEVQVGHVDSGGIVAGVHVTQKGVLPLDEVVVRRSYLERVWKTYAEPAGFGSLASLEQRIVVFDLAEGTGRTTHAEALANRLAEPVAAVPAFGSGPGEVYAPAIARRGVSRLMFGGSPHFPVNRLPTEQDKVWLLEIPADEEDFQVVGFGDDLPELDRRLRAQRCHLLVLTRPDQWRRIGGGYSHLWFSAATIDTVTALEVATAQLTGRINEATATRWLDHSRIRVAVESSSYGVVVEVVDSIMAALATPPEMLLSDREKSTKSEPEVLDDDAVLARRIAMVLDSRGKWRQQLLDWHRKSSRTAFERDFQLTAAAMTELPVAHVYYGAIELNRQFAGNSKTDTNYLQAAPGVIQMLDVVGATLTGDDRIRFPRPGWADAILEYFWLDRPLARVKFIEWLASAPKFQTGDALESVSDEQRRAVARRIVRFALQWAARQERDAPLAKLAVEWRSSKLNLWKELVDTISAVASAQDDDSVAVGPEIAALVKHRGYVHRCLLRWARDGGIEQVHLVLAVCAGPFTDRYTSKALIRLKHTARLLDDQTRPILAKVISQLWREPSARATLIAEISGWCDTEGQRLAGCTAFAGLAEQGVEETDGESPGGLELLREAGDYTPNAELLGRCWWAFLNTADEQDRKRLVSLWLTAAVTDQEQRDVVLKVLRSAARGTTENARVVRDNIRVIANGWAEGQPVRTALYYQLADAFDVDLRNSGRLSAEDAP